MTPEPIQALQFDGKLSVAVGQSRHETKWKNKEITWSQLLKKLSTTTRTPETGAEYLAMPKPGQDERKDVGGFVGGSLKEGRRILANVAWRHLLTLDADYADANFWTKVQLMLSCAACVYSTHKHRPESPRFRLVIPLARAVSAEEYVAIAKRIAADVGIDLFDDTTYDPARLFYWPSTSADADFVFEVQDEEWLDPDKTLARYTDWRDPSFWPESSRTRDRRKKTADKQGDPLAKPGLVGIFCRAYSIPEAIAEFLPEVYEPCGTGRYTYNKGTSAGGLVLYEDKFAFSHHGTDPISGQLVNAFDLVRIHKFGAQDEDHTKLPMIKLPSYAAMVEFAGKDAKVKEFMAAERRAEAEADFACVNWTSRLRTTKGGFFASTIDNVKIVLENDPLLTGKIRLNEFTRQIEIVDEVPWGAAKGPWSDSDDAALRHYFEKLYNITVAGKISDALAVVVQQTGFHPIRDYLQGLDWDGLPRAETVLIDYLGAPDNAYVRAVTRKFFAAGVARIMVPGIKFDYMLTLIGPQGIGKSEIIKRLARDWHSDSFSTVQGKEAYEQLQGAWILEVAELTATRKAEVEAVKHFISKREDAYRQAYGRRVSHFPRQCVFVGTTNDPDCLRDRTGNRRFWPVDVRGGSGKKSIWRHLTDEEVGQIWGEAVDLWRCGESLHLEGAVALDAISAQEAHTEESALTGMIESYLERMLPLNWYDLNIAARRSYLHQRGDFGDKPLGEYALKRTRVCALEIWVELLEGDPKNLQWAMSRQITEVMRKITGWEEIGRKIFTSPYGRQRCFEKK